MNKKSDFVLLCGARVYKVDCMNISKIMEILNVVTGKLHVAFFLVLLCLANVKTLAEEFKKVQPISAEEDVSSIETIDFNHERCQTDTISGYFSEISHFYPVESFLGESGVLDLLVRFKGPSDGHVALTPFANTSEPAYIVIMGSNENKLSEIRQGMYSNPVFKINTPGILSSIQFRGFLIRYNEKRGELWVYSEGSYMPLLHFKDPKPLKVRYFGFAAYDDVVLEVAFNCEQKDLHSLVFQHKSGLLPSYH